MSVDFFPSYASKTKDCLCRLQRIASYTYAHSNLFLEIRLNLVLIPVYDKDDNVSVSTKYVTF